MPKETQPKKEQIKVTDRRIFTAEGEIREEFRSEIHPSDPARPSAAPPVEQAGPAAAPAPDTAPRASEPARKSSDSNQRRRSVAESAENPDTPFSEFIEGLIAQAYMFLGMLPQPGQPPGKMEPAAARQMIDILNLLKEKTAGNLTPGEEDFLTTHLAQLKLAFVQRTKTI